MDFVTVATYYLMLFVFFTALYVFSGWLMTKCGVTTTHRIGIVLHCLFFAILLVIKKKLLYTLLNLG